MDGCETSLGHLLHIPETARMYWFDTYLLERLHRAHKDVIKLNMRVSVSHVLRYCDSASSDRVLHLQGGGSLKAPKLSTRQHREAGMARAGAAAEAAVAAAGAAAASPAGHDVGEVEEKDAELAVATV